MTGVAGRQFIIELNGGGSVWNTIGGGRELTLSINNEIVDTTNKDSAGIRQLLEGAGVTSVSITVSGVHVDSAALDTIRTAALGNDHKTFRVTDPASTNGGVYSGSFAIASFEQSGTYNESMAWNLTLESAGTVSFT